MNKNFKTIIIVFFILSNFKTFGQVYLSKVVTPTFTQVHSICEGDFLAPLPTISLNGITGVWSPTLDPKKTMTYLFTPDSGQLATTTTMTIEVNQVVIPMFTQVDPICVGDVLAPLPTTSLNGITGVWSPALDNTMTTTYTFMPDVLMLPPPRLSTTNSLVPCATVVTMEIEVNQIVMPMFTQVDPICAGDVLAPLPTTSLNGITGVWTPALDNTMTRTYTFTPDVDPCATIMTMEIEVNQILMPMFTQVDPICLGDVLAPLPTTSLNGITGVWSPALDDTMTRTYTFTPDVDPCATTVTMEIEVNQIVMPMFTLVDPICVGDVLAPLPTTSLNGITGVWSPALDNTMTRTYTFTPDVDSCATLVTMEIEVNQIVMPMFTQVDPICLGDVLAPLPTTSLNGITGVWSPALDNTMTRTYTFTPDVDSCATLVTMEIEVNQIVIPMFTQVDPICAGDVLAPLPTTSLNGITGVWTPALDNTMRTTYTFTSGVDPCAITTMTIEVNQVVIPMFTQVDPICAGDVLAPLPTTSLNGITGTWSPALDNTRRTTYTFTPDVDPCTTIVTMTIEVNQLIMPMFTQVDPICLGDVLAPLPTFSLNGITGFWTPALDDTTTTTYTFTPDVDPCATLATMIIVVNPIITPTFTQVDPICAGDVLAPLPTTSLNGITGVWSPALDNTTTTTYTFTPGVVPCAITTMIIEVNPIITPTFTQVDAICIGDVLAPLPTISVEGITGVWSPALDNTTTTTYTFTPDVDPCTTLATMIIEVNAINILTISATNTSEDFDPNQIISTTVIGGSGTYEYQLDGGDWQSNSIFQNVEGCNEHIIAVRDAFGCSNIAEVSFMILEFPKFFTPNGDTFNDTWNIKCLRDNPLAKISIFDRYGKLLYQYKPSNSAWDGTLNGEILPETDYWFTVEYVNQDEVVLTKRSHFSLRH